MKLEVTISPTKKSHVRNMVDLVRGPILTSRTALVNLCSFILFASRFLFLPSFSSTCRQYKQSTSGNLELTGRQRNALD